MEKHTARTPSEQLPTIRVSDGTRLNASVASYQGGPGPNAIQASDDGKTVHWDPTDAYFDIVLEVDHKAFSKTGDWGWPTLGAILKEIAASGYQVHCCLTCQHYEPSRMVDEWSLGAEGYCLAAGEPDMEHLTHMLHECRLWAERGDRESWFGREFTHGLTPRGVHGDSSEEGRNMGHQNRRGLGPEFIHDLKEGLLQSLLERVQCDNTLLLQIRDKYVSIYYRGGTLTEIHWREHHIYEEMFDGGYCGSHGTARAPAKKTVIRGAAEVSALLEQLPARKQAMDLFFAKHSAEEREIQQAIVRANNRGPLGRATDFYFCDIEYKTALGDEFDIVGMCWPSDPQSRKNQVIARLVLAELKHGDSALEGSAGLGEHVGDINRFLEDPGNLKSLKTEMVDVFNRQRELGLIDCGKDLVSFSDEPPMLLLLLANHDPARSQLPKQLEKLPESPHAEILFATASLMGYGIFKEGILTKEQFLERCAWNH
jgi:hypothetical protein